MSPCATRRYPLCRVSTLYADFCDTQLFAVDPAASRPVEIPLGLTAKQVTSFGTDANGYVYVTSAGGTLHRIDP